MKKKLICIPHAGGNAAYFCTWSDYLSDCINVVPVELSGHGSRIDKPLYTEVKDVVNDIYPFIKLELDGSYHLFGHSLGCLIAYELLLKIMDNNDILPESVFFSGLLHPGVRIPELEISRLDPDKFRSSIMELGGTPSIVFENKELADLCLPILRADFSIYDNYVYSKMNKRLQCKISVLYGKDDRYTPVEYINEWDGFSEIGCEYFSFNGEHFFIQDRQKEVLGVINNVIMRDET